MGWQCVHHAGETWQGVEIIEIGHTCVYRKPIQCKSNVIVYTLGLGLGIKWDCDHMVQESIPNV